MEKHIQSTMVDSSDIYSKQDIQERVDNDQISAAEEGFMLGYLKA